MKQVKGREMRGAHLVSMGHTAYWWVMRWSAWLLLLGLVIIGAALGSAMVLD